MWQLWSAWQQVWINPWGWSVVIFGIFFIFKGVKWNVRILPWALSYILLTSTGFAFRNEHFNIAPVTMSALLSLCIFMMYCAMPDLKVFKIELWRMIIVTLGLLAGYCALYAYLYPADRPDASYLMPVFWNRSVGGAFAVAALATTPFLYHGLIAAILLARSTPLLVFFTYWAAIKNTGSRIYKCALVLIGVLLYQAWPFNHVGIEHFKDWYHRLGTGRQGFWAIYWHQWVGFGTFDKLIGTHFGTTSVLLPMAQMTKEIEPGGQIFLWMHNDFYQALTEFGYIGFVLLAASFIEIFRKCTREQKALGLALLVGMIGNFPWHWFPEVLVYWYWVKKNAVSRISSCQPTHSHAFQPANSKKNSSFPWRLLHNLYARELP